MKRSTFFKSLLGIAVAPAAAKWIGKDEMEKEYLNKEAEAKRIRASKPLIQSVQGIPGTAVVPETAWEPIGPGQVIFEPIKPFK